MGLKIKKLTSKAWIHIDDITGRYVLTNFYAREEFGKFVIIEAYGSQRTSYAINEIEVYDIGGSAETFNNFDQLETRLSNLSYQGFAKDGAFLEAPEDGKTYGRKDAAWVEIVQWSNSYIIKDEIVCTDVATNYYFRVNNSNSTYTPTATSGTSPDFTTCLGQTNAYRYIDSFTLPYAVKLNKIIVIINNEFNYSFTLAFGYHLKNNASNSVSNPTSILEAAITKGSYRRFYKEYTSVDFGNVTIPANHSLITGWFLQGIYVRIYFEIEKI